MPTTPSPVDALSRRLAGRRSVVAGTVALGLVSAAGPAAAKKKHRKPTCCDGTQNGAETDVDCGGPDCPPCGTGRLCATNTDCSTARCGDALGGGNVCQACTHDGVCGSDANGGCLCDSATGACLTDHGDLPVRDDCTGCPPRTICGSSIDGFFCVPLCGG